MPKGLFLGSQCPRLGVRVGAGVEGGMLLSSFCAPSRALGVTLLMWPYCVRDIVMCPFDRLESHHCKMTFIFIVSLVFLMTKETHAQLKKNSNLTKIHNVEVSVPYNPATPRDDSTAEDTLDFFYVYAIITKDT